MRHLARSVILAALVAACSSRAAPDAPPVDTTHAARKPDPYVTVRVRNLMDTTTAPARTLWHIYAVLTGPVAGENGYSYAGSISVTDIRLDHNRVCVRVGADSVGERLLSVVALSDTAVDSLNTDASATSLAQAWYQGTTTLPSGWAALFNPPADAWNSQQYLAGHGRTMADPIRWGLDWIRPDSIHFYEIPQPDTTACNMT